MNVHAVHQMIDIDTLMASGIRLAADPATSLGALNRFVDHVIELESRTSGGLDTKCVRYADVVLADVFERGWQPAELIHVIKRRLDKPNVPMIKALMGSHSRKTRALSIAPHEWREQLLDLGVDPSTDLVHYRRSFRVDARTFWTALFRLLAEFRYSGSIEEIGLPPSRWTAATSVHSTHHPDTKVLNKIRGLLAKAESTTFIKEAESFSAKAQELMTRYAIDTAVVDSAEGSPLGAMVMTRRILVDNPYADAKMQLMSSVAATNGVKTVWHKKRGLISITGMPVDLDLCELLYTSLLVQSARALDQAGSDPTCRSRGFRRAFLLGYAWRIRERLAEARARADREAGQTYGSSLVPILAERDKAVSSVFEALFPDLRSIKISVSDRNGVLQGRKAAEHADLNGGRARIDE
ncbi:DUF2786 domain-containing protein [Rhodococcus sp. G-MC3]|uniref:DUF2786 domain-containing protein n=1 Tax=Rhodococcus sp. G-MC3 TaxID=3046209 RepID=UPI0024B93E54|nr:DUF2786 domain-containing protein [Rhodococcus sp. G-MC3]MDJ0396075.1 DUF2786 domain-containing protein [Rhodococcus sp. G-MC3]